MSKVIYHLTIEHIYYLLNYQCYLTLKADGYYKKGNVLNCDCEYEELNNKKYIFNNLDDTDNIQNKMFNLADSIKLDYPQELKEELNKNNINKITELYLDYYDNLDLEIIPKFYLKIKKENFLDILKILINYFPTNGFPNDGWVIVPENEELIAKVKPINHLTIDLKFKYGKFFAYGWKEVFVNNSKKLKNNVIYRCYWIDNKWEPKEERNDKKNGNSLEIIEIITNYLMKGYNLNEFNLDNNNCYYDHIKNNNKEHIDYFKFMNNESSMWLSKNLIINDDLILLNVGCGKTSGHNTLKEIGIKNIVGIDSDPICILKSTINSRSNNYILMDINYDWNIKEQCQRFGNIWQVSQLYKLKNLYKKFNVILFNFSIFYCNEENYSKLIKSLDNVSEKGSKVFFNYFDYSKCSAKLITEFDIDIRPKSVKVKLPWKTTYHKEPRFNNENFCKLLLDNNWKLINKSSIENKYPKYEDWQDLIIYEIWEKN